MAAMLVALFVVVVGCDSALEAASTDTASPIEVRTTQARVVAPDRERLEAPPPPVPVDGDPIQLLDARRMVWNDARFEDAQVGDELRYHNLLYRLTSDGLEYVDVASDEALANADAAWDANAEHTYPDDRDFVYVLGGPPDGGHRRLGYVQPGQRVAFQGRVFEIGSFGPRMTLKPTGDVIARVTHTYKRQAPEVIDATVEYDDGTQDVLTGTPNHPFWVPAVDDYVQLSELEVGTRLHTASGTGAILVSKTWRQGDFEVFDIEVEGAHNFYVRGEGSDAPGVLVHNSTADGVPAFRAVSRTEADDIAAHGFRPDPSGRSMDAKWFSESREGAEQFTQTYDELTEVVETTIPRDVYQRSYRNPNTDNTGPGVCVACEDLPLLPKPE